MNENKPKFILVMGIAGSGKSTIGKLLAATLDIAFIDADDYHPTPNIEKMSRGEPLTDSDRWPWLEILSVEVNKYQSGCIFACSALKESYRKYLSDKIPTLQIIYLHGEESVLLERITQRTHFFPVALLSSQLETLEIPSGPRVAVINIDQPITQVVAEAARFIDQLKIN
jgi:gluconokinase